jgi:mono/diheme cytochrome c family protein
MSARLFLPLALVGVALVSCDESEAYHELDPSWSRMLSQPRANAFGRSAVFEDGKVMRLPPRGTIPHDADDGEPPPLTRELVTDGRASYEITCAACHGIVGDGRSVVAEKMSIRRPPSFGEPRLRALEPAAIVQIIDRGYGLMPSYADMIPPRRRWAVAAYVKALQISQGTPASELPPELLGALPREKP